MYRNVQSHIETQYVRENIYQINAFGIFQHSLNSEAAFCDFFKYLFSRFLKDIQSSLDVSALSGYPTLLQSR